MKIIGKYLIRIFFFLSLISILFFFYFAMRSFCTILHHPSSYNTVDTILDPSKMDPQRTKMDKTPKNVPEMIFFYFFLFMIILTVILGISRNFLLCRAWEDVVAIEQTRVHAC